MRKTPAHGVGDAADLLVDLLEHVVGVVPLAYILFRHLDLGNIVVGSIPLDRGEGESLAVKDGDLVVVQIDDIAGVTDDGTDIASQEILPLPDTKNQRTTAAGSDKDSGKICMHDGDPISTGNLT